MDTPGDGLTSGTGDNTDDQRLNEIMSHMFGDHSEEVLQQMRQRGIDPLAMLRAEGQDLPDLATIQAAMAQMQTMLASSGDDPVNTKLAHDMARQYALEKGDPALTAQQAKEATDALTVAQLWLDAATSLPPATGQQFAWSRSQWVEETLPTWLTLVNPVAQSVAQALATVLGADQDSDFSTTDSSDDSDYGQPAGAATLGGAPGMDALGLGNLTPSQLVRKMGAAAFGMQVGQAAGTLSREVFGSTDVGLPLLVGQGTALLPTNIEAYAQNLDIPLDEVRLFVAVREAAHARLFAHVPWLRSHMLGLVDQYARGITIDLAALEDRIAHVDHSSPSGLQQAMSGGGLFATQPTEQQQATLLRLETALALVEGWVDEVSTQAALPHLPGTFALREMLRRRRAAGGPAEQTFASLVGLDLRPRRSRDAATLFTHVYTAGGVEGRDGVWSHPDLLPVPLDLDDPAGYLARRQAQAMAQSDIDKALEELLGSA